ncbi:MULTISPECIES: UTRA domain-containing protein [Burkholderia cepacia complex]|nr:MULTISPECIES: UTRA domain-containing protein [Burkholderia cepacia complex]
MAMVGERHMGGRFAGRDRLEVMRIFDGLLPRSSDITDADMSVTAVGSPMEVAAHLRIALHSPLLVLRHPSRMSDGRACESTVFHIRPERFDLVVRSGVEAKFVG